MSESLVLNGAVTQLAAEVKRLREQTLAQSQITGVQTTHIQMLWNRLEAAENRIAAFEEVNLALAKRVEALESVLTYSPAEIQ